MIALIFILALGVWLIHYKESEVLSDPNASEFEQYWQTAHDSIKEKKYLKAEKALLTILQNDEKNAVAYNRLGILYARQGQSKEAIECFEIAQSLESNPSNLHNVGLIYYNIGEYGKSAIAFEQAIELENDLAVRHIAYAKVQEKLGNKEKMISALEKAVGIEENPQTLKMLAVAYEQAGQRELARILYEKADNMITKQVKPKGLDQPRKVVM